MARVNLSVPDDLLERVRNACPGLNLSEVLRDALGPRLRCRHERLGCATCRAELERVELVDQALGVFYGAVMEELANLVRSELGTAEGAARVVKRVAERFGVSEAQYVALPRPTRRERHAALVAKVADLPGPARKRRERSA